MPVGETCGDAHLWVNDTVSIKLPLGFRYLMTNDGIRGATDYWSSIQDGRGGPGYYVFDGYMRNRADCAVLQNIGFDVEQNWDKMTEGGVHPEDQVKIKHNFCKKIINIDKPKCMQFYRSSLGTQIGANYDDDLFNACKNMPDWYNKQSCRTSFNNAVKATDAGSASIRQQAKDKIREYCETDAGSRQVDGICGCYNVMKHGGECLRSKKDLPGCKELAATLGDLPGGAQVAFADKFCASDVCVTQALGNAALLPDYTQGKQCPNIAQCVQDFRQANFQGSSVNSECKNTINISGVPPPTTPAGGSPIQTSPSTGGTASTGGTGGSPIQTSPSTGDSVKTKSGSGNTAIIIAIIIALCCSLILGVVSLFIL
jgi:hypothetical protein